jgi:phage shock protein PspC (stress-responsive transcriptional regulator)
MNAPPPVPTFKISRAGKIILELDGPSVFQAMTVGQILLTDYYWTIGMSDWATVGSRKDWDVLAGSSAQVVPASSVPLRTVTGRVLDFNIASSAGLISGNDGVRYIFQAKEWRSNNVLPQSGVQVEFEANGYSALGIYVVSGASSSAVKPGGSTVQDGFYRSSDNKLLGGVCAGLAHKWGSNTVLIRIIALFVPIGIPIYIVMWLSVPERPTNT